MLKRLVLFILTGIVSLNEAAAFDSTCKPYRPFPGYQYVSKLLMDRLHSPQSRNPGPYLSAHRGAWYIPGELLPENSLSAVDKAIELKFEMMALDVRLSNEGELVLMHDYTLSRTTNANNDWNVILAKTETGYQPQYTNDWDTLNDYDPLTAKRETPAITSLKHRIFNRDDKVRTTTVKLPDGGGSIDVEV
jgi:glycerophosphoryl diester phosphodiesterase